MVHLPTFSIHHRCRFKLGYIVCGLLSQWCFVADYVCWLADFTRVANATALCCCVSRPLGRSTHTAPAKVAWQCDIDWKVHPAPVWPDIFNRKWGEQLREQGSNLQQTYSLYDGPFWTCGQNRTDIQSDRWTIRHFVVMQSLEGEACNYLSVKYQQLTSRGRYN